MKFHHIYIEILNYCQFNCSFCPKTKRNPRAMTVDEFTHIIQEIKPYTDTIYLHVLGEPLLHEQLDDLLSVSEAYQMHVNITTNGYAIKEKEDILLRHNDLNKINISLHALEDENHKHLSLTDYMNNIQDFTKKAVEHNITIIYRLWDTNKKDTTILNILKEAYPDIEFTNEVSPQNGRKLAYRVFLHQSNQFEWPVQSTKTEEDNGYCLGLKSHIAILSDGTIVPCCLDSEGQIALGNIFTDSLESIITSEKAVAIRDGFRQHKAVHPLCKKCSYKDRFGI